MPDPSREMFEALKQTAEGMIQANEGIKRMADAALLARDEHEDLRETVARLEGLVLDLVRKSTPPDSPIKNDLGLAPADPHSFSGPFKVHFRQNHRRRHSYPQDGAAVTEGPDRDYR
jgi:hypothetical protein